MKEKYSGQLHLSPPLGEMMMEGPVLEQHPPCLFIEFKTNKAVQYKWLKTDSWDTPEQQAHLKVLPKFARSES